MLKKSGALSNDNLCSVEDYAEDVDLEHTGTGSIIWNYYNVYSAQE